MKNKQNISKFLVLFGFGLCSLNNVSLYAKKLSEDEIIQTSKEELATYARYGKNFTTKSNKNIDKETELEANFTKLDIKLENIDHNLYNRLEQDIKDLKLLSKKLSHGNKKNPDIIAMQDNIKFYISNISKLLSFFKKHKNFIHGYQILNFYSDITAEQNKIAEWVTHKINSLKTNTSFTEWCTGMTHNFYVYPLISYKGKVESDIKWIKKIQNSEYSNMSKKLKPIQTKIQESLISLQKTNEYRVEQQEQRKDQRQAELNSLMYCATR